MAEALAQLVGADEAAVAGLPSQALAWVAHTSVLQSLLTLCAPADLLKSAGLGAVWVRDAAQASVLLLLPALCTPAPLLQP